MYKTLIYIRFAEKNEIVCTNCCYGIAILCADSLNYTKSNLNNHGYSSQAQYSNFHH
jgi:hypothetical protein